MATQLTLKMRSPRRRYEPVLVDLNCAASVLKVNPANVIEMAECGDLVWVWDLARAGAVRRELRFDLGEIFRVDAGLPASTETLDQVVERIIGRPMATELHTGTVGDILQVRPPTVHEWLQEGALTGPPLAGHKQLIYRASLVKFLKERLVG